MIENLIGIDSDYIIIVLAVLVIILLVLAIVSLTQISGLKKKLDSFTRGKEGKDLEDMLTDCLDQIDELVELNAANERNIEAIYKRLKSTFQKFCVYKYNALDEMGGNMSFALAMLDEVNNGYILNIVHTREGSYTYVKEIIAGNSVLALAEEEEEALKRALGDK